MKNLTDDVLSFSPLEAAKFLDLDVKGVVNLTIDRAERTISACQGSVTWIKSFDPKHAAAVEKINGALVVTPVPTDSAEIAFVDRLSLTCAVICSPQPRLSFARLLGRFFSHLEATVPVGIDPSARIERTATIGSDVTIGAFCYVGHGAEIGDGTVLHPGAVVHSRTVVGKRCILNPNCVIGGRGFGFVRRDDGILEHFPQIGRVVLEDDVEIGACTAIDRPGLGETRLKSGTKVDNVVHIAHNAVIGPDAAVVAGAEVGASVVIERGAWLGPNACSIENIRIGRDAFVGIGATVLRDVPDGQVVAGNPAEPIEIVKKTRKALKKLIESAE